MSVTKLHERFERIERAYLAALDGRYPETVPHSILASGDLRRRAGRHHRGDNRDVPLAGAQGLPRRRTLFRARGLDQNADRYRHVQGLCDTCCAVDLHARDGSGRLHLLRQVRRCP